jgi:hypothetical protein
VHSSGRSRILKRGVLFGKTRPLPIVHLNSHTHFSLFTGALENFKTIEEPPLAFLFSAEHYVIKKAERWHVCGFFYVFLE